MARKSGRDPCYPKSWRPIALLSCIGKLLEKIVALRMVAALKDRFKSTQFGGRSTTEALQFMLTIVYGAWSESRPRVVTLLALDISGAYDNVDRAELLKRLVDESMPDWIIAFNRSFLSNRRARFHMPGYKSDSIGLQAGIPQGSPLSPILFLIFAAPLMEVSWDIEHLRGSLRKAKVYTFSYVDDTYLIAVSDSYKDNCRGLEIIHRKLQHVARPLSIAFGPEKYNLMHFHRPKTTHGGDRTVVHKIGGAKLTPADTLKVLGVEVDFQLNWNAHIGKIITNVNRALGYLAQISGSTWGPSLQRMRQFYLTKIRPMITYACGAWFIKKRRGEGYLSWGLKQDQVLKLESLQHMCLRLLSGSFFITNGLVLEKELHIESIWTVLYAQATTQRAKALSRGWTTGFHAMEVMGEGMPAGTFSFVLDGDPDLNLSSDLFDTLVHPTVAWLKAYNECSSRGLFPQPYQDIFYFPTATYLQGIKPLLGGTSFLQTNFNVGQPWDYKKLAETHQDLLFSAWKAKYYQTGPRLDVSSPALDLVKVKLEFVEQQRESDYLHSSLNLCKREKKRLRRVRRRWACIKTEAEDDTEEGQRMRTLFGDVHKVPPCMTRFEERRYREERRA